MVQSSGMGRDAQCDSRPKSRVNMILETIDTCLDEEQKPFDEAPGLPESYGVDDATLDAMAPQMSGRTIPMS